MLKKLFVLGSGTGVDYLSRGVGIAEVEITFNTNFFYCQLRV